MQKLNLKIKIYCLISWKYFWRMNRKTAKNKLAEVNEDESI